MSIKRKLYSVWLVFTRLIICHFKNQAIKFLQGESEDGQQQQPQQPQQPSAPPPPMFSPIYAPSVSSYPSLPYSNVYHDQAFQPMTSYSVTPPPSSDRFVAGEAGEQQERIVTGYEEEPSHQQQQFVPAATPTLPPSASLPPPPSSERSEAAGSDRRDELPPPPPPTSTSNIFCFMPNKSLKKLNLERYLRDSLY